MIRKTVKTTQRAEAENALFPDVAPIRRSKKRVKGEPAVSRPVALKPIAAPAVTAQPSPAPQQPLLRRSRVAAVGGVAVMCLGVGGFLGTHLLASEADATKTSRLAIAARSTQPSAVALSAPASDARASSEASDLSQGGLAVAASTAAPQPSAVSSPKSELKTALENLVAASKRHDARAVEAAKEALAKLVAANPSAALVAILAALKAESDPLSLAVLSTALLDDALAGNPEVLSALKDMARDDDLPARRAMAVRTLGNLPGGDQARVDLLAGMERDDTDPSVREAAAVALGVVADRSPGDVAAAAAKSLVDALSSETDPRVRSMLLYAVRDTRASDVTSALIAALANDPDEAPRLAAADVLGDVAAAYRSEALDALAAQVPQATDPRLASTLITSIVSAGRLSAIPVLQRLRAGAGSLQPMIDDYLAGLTSGEDNMDKLEALRIARETARAR